jgi:hypothetical protein
MYDGLRQEVSLLLSEGHNAARRYPIAMVWTEARMVRQRWAERRVTEAVVMQATIASVLSKEGGSHFQTVLQELRDGD